MFGELAIAFGYIDDKALRQYVESRPRLNAGRPFLTDRYSADRFSGEAVPHINLLCCLGMCWI